MRRPIGAILVLLNMVLLGGCSHWHSILVAESEIPFSSFTASVKNAKKEDFSKFRGTRVESESALKK